MNITEFRKTYPQYNDLGDADVTKAVNEKHPGLISAPPAKREVEIKDAGEVKLGEYVEWYDPRRILPDYGYKKGLAPSEVQEYGAEKFFNTVVPEGEMRDRVNIAATPNKTVIGLRKQFPQYDDMDDEKFMGAVTTHYPEYSDVETDVKLERGNLFREIDRIEYKKANNMRLTPREFYINTVAIPEDSKRTIQQAVLGYGDMASFGLQNFVLSRMGFSQARPESGVEAVAAGVGSLAGFISSPLKLAGEVVKAIPGLNAIFVPINATSRTQKILKPLLRGGFTLGTASALLIPEQTATDQGLLQPGQRLRSFGSGFMFGTGLAGLGYIPNRAARMITSSLFFGLPSTLREETLEEQVFNYGYGAYSGMHGTQELIKSEGLLRNTIEKGVSDQRDVKDLISRGDILLEKFETLTRSEGQPYTDIINSGRNFYTPAHTGWRKETTKWIKVRLGQIRQESGFRLRNDKISQLFEQIKGVKLSDLTDAQLFNIQQHTTPENTPEAPTTAFATRPPFRPELKGSPKAKHISLWHQSFRLGYESLEHMGLGGMFSEGLTGTVVKSDVKSTQTLKLHRELGNVWKKLVGLNGETSRRLFLTEDGRLNMKELAANHPEYTKEYKVANQIRRYLNTWLDVQNRHRAKYGMEPIKPENDYITHIFDSTRRSAQKEKFPFPDYLADIMEFIPAKQAGQPFLKSRRGAKGYKENIWAALDAYAFRGSDYVSDDGLRQVNGVVKWLDGEIRINQKEGKRSPIDLIGIKKNLRDWGDRYSGRPGKIDEFFRRATLRLPDGIKEYVSSMESVSGLWRTLIYTGYMGWRPKLALRNLGQHSLILGEVGPAHLWKAITTRGSEEAQKILRESAVLQTRELGFAPEMPYTVMRGTLEEARNSAFWMFKNADRINVEDAFLSGYYEAKSMKKPHDLAVKRGDEVAAHTQFMYTKGNRGPVSNLWGLSTSLGRFASMFTTWPINKVELDIAWSREGNRHKIARYLGVVALGGLASMATGNKLRSTAYTGFGAEAGVMDKIKDGIVSVKGLPLVPGLLIGKDVKDAMEDDSLWKLVLYDIKKNGTFWEKF